MPEVVEAMAHVWFSCEPKGESVLSLVGGVISSADGILANSSDKITL